MLRKLLLFFLVLMVFGCARLPKPLTTGRWTKKPKGFSEYKAKNRSARWHSSQVSLAGTSYAACVGPYKYDHEDDKYDYYCIDIEEPKQNESIVIAELCISLKHVSDESLEKPAEELVTYDSHKKTVTFDLGKSVFVYQF